MQLGAGIFTNVVSPASMAGPAPATISPDRDNILAEIADYRNRKSRIWSFAASKPRCTPVRGV
jgi:hypothetical protein